MVQASSSQSSQSLKVTSHPRFFPHINKLIYSRFLSITWGKQNYKFYHPHITIELYQFSKKVETSYRSARFLETRPLKVLWCHLAWTTKCYSSVCKNNQHFADFK